MSIKNGEKYCPDENSTFKDAKSFFAWANEKRMLREAISLWNKNMNNHTKVIYKSKFDTIYNKVDIVDANSKKE